MNKIVMLLLVLLCLSCDESKVPRRAKHQGQQKVNIDPPSNNAKIVWIFPAGAGAARLSLGILAALEEDSGKKFANIHDLVGGVSSGSLIAAALSSGRHTSDSLKTALGPMLRRVFTTINDLGDELMKPEFDFKLGELAALFKEISNSSNTTLDFSTQATTEKSIQDALTKAASSADVGIEMVRKIKKLTDSSGNLKPSLQTIISGLTGISGGMPVGEACAQRLGNEIDNELGAGLTIGDPKMAKVIAIASFNKNPVFFASDSLASFLGGPYAINSSLVRHALTSSAAIPNIIKANFNIQFHDAPGGALSIKSPLDDGFFAVGGFDPSAKFYEIFAKAFADEEIIFVYVGNGADPDKKFRQDIFNFTSGVAEKKVKDKRHIFISLDGRIKDARGRNLFDLAGFFDNQELYDIMDKVALDIKAKSAAYQWLVGVLKAR